MNRDEAYEIMFRSFYDELGGIEKEAMEKEAIIGAIKGIGGALGMAGGLKPLAGGLARGAQQFGRQMWTAGGQALKHPQLAAESMKQVYRGAGGGLKGVGAALRTPMGAATGLGATGAGTLGATRALGGGRQRRQRR